MLNKHIICLTPDRNFLSAAVFAAQRLLSIGLEPTTDIALVCSSGDIEQVIASNQKVGTAFWINLMHKQIDRANHQFRFNAFCSNAKAIDSRIRIITHSFDMPDPLSLSALPLGRHLTMAAYRRLLLPHILPNQYKKILYLDCDTLSIRNGINDLFSLDLKGHAFAAALDMILLKDFENGPLTERFQHYRKSLGFELSTPYFNSGVLLIDREQWLAQAITESTLAFARTFPDLCRFQDQSALNAVTRDLWLPLSPRFNFMGDFLHLDLLQEIRPVILHFVNDPKPWQKDRWNGPAWMQSIYEAKEPEAIKPQAPALSPDFKRFRESLLNFLAKQDFADN